MLARAKVEVQVQVEGGGWEDRSSSNHLLTVELALDASKINPYTQKRLATCMRKLGWSGPDKMRIKGVSVRGFARRAEAPGAAALPLRVADN